MSDQREGLCESTAFAGDWGIVSCELPAGHDGNHRATISWDDWE